MNHFTEQNNTNGSVLESEELEFTGGKTEMWYSLILEDDIKIPPYYELSICFHKYGPAYDNFMLKNVIVVLNNTGADYLGAHVLVGIPTEKHSYLIKMAQELLGSETLLTDYVYKKTGYTFLYANINDSAVADHLVSLSKKNHSTKSRILGYGSFRLNALPRREQKTLQWKLTNFHLTLDGVDNTKTPLV